MTNMRIVCETGTRGYGWAIGIAAGVFIALLIILIEKLSGRMVQKFDERQLAARGEAYKWGFFSMMLYEAAYAVFGLLGVHWADETAGPLIGIFVGVAVFGCVAEAKDAYVAMDEKPASRWVWSLLGVLWLVIGILKLTGGEGFVDGLFTLDSLQFFMGLCFLAVGVTQLIHMLVNRKEKVDEE